MPCPHFSISICSRGGGGSSVAGSAYQSGEKLYCVYDDDTKDYEYKSEEIVFKEVVLPENAPEDYSDRATLWNSVEKAEPNWNSQLARKIIIALPKELSDADNISLLHEYVSSEFVHEGMIADVAIHRPHKKKEHKEDEKKDDAEEDKKKVGNIPNGQENIHAHVMLTMRAIDEEGEWKAKSRKEIVKDKNGNIKLNKNGNPVTRKVYTTNWDDRGNAEKWRKDWENLQNKYLERAGREERVCLDSYEKQGIDLLPTVHKGPAVCAMEARGIETYIGNINRTIEGINRIIKDALQSIKRLSSWLSEVIRNARQLDIEPKEISVYDICKSWFKERSKQRDSWDNKYAASHAEIKDLEKIMQICNYVYDNKIFTIEDFAGRLQDIEAKLKDARNENKSISRQKSKVEGIIKHAERKKELEPINKKANGFGFGKARYKEQHADELKEYDTCCKYLRVNLGEKTYNKKELAKELKYLEAKSCLKTHEVNAIKAEKDLLGYIKYIINKSVPELLSENKPLTVEQKKLKRESLKVKLEQKKEESQMYKRSSTYKERNNSNHIR